MQTQTKSAFAPKSDQLNADDLVGGNLVITITNAILVGDSSTPQPVHIHYEGDKGKPYKPSKGMGRILEAVWGMDYSKWAGHSLELYRDENVRFGRDLVGGIRIKSMTGISKPYSQLTTVSRGKRVPVVVQPLVMNTQPKQQQGTQHQAAQPSPATYPEEAFAEAFSRMEEAIKTGQSSVLKVVEYLERTAPLTQAQKTKLEKVAQAAALG